jgi:hypothetical protein
MRRGGQAAVEFLTTYGGAFLVMIAVIAAVIQLDVLNTSPSASTCISHDDIRCDETRLLLTENETLIPITNDGRATQTISAPTLYGGTGNVSCYPSQARIQPRQSVLVLCLNTSEVTRAENAQLSFTRHRSSLGPRYGRQGGIDLRVGRKQTNNPEVIRDAITAHATQPNTVPGLQLWLDASDQSTISTENDNVTAWTDKASNIVFAQSTEDERPEYTAQSVRFDGTEVLIGPEQLSNVWAGPGNQFSYFAVLENQVDDTFVWFAKYGDSNQGEDEREVQLRLYQDKLYPLYGLHPTGQFSTYEILDGPTVARDQAFLLGGSWDASQTGIAKHTLSFNGQNQTPTFAYDTGSNNDIYNGDGNLSLGGYVGTTGVTSPIIGAGEIKEILIYDNALSLAEEELVQGYLAYKWSLNDELPADHPYTDLPSLS